jgi:gluconate 5-dehydrogenase
MFDLNNKVAIVTGAASGIGLGLVKTFSKMNVSVIAVDKSDKLDKTIDAIGIDTSKYISIISDVVKDNDITNILKQTIDKYGKVDILANCAGVNVRKELKNYTNADWDLIQNVNAKAIFNFSNRVSEIMKKQKKGRIINLSSTQGVTCWNGKGRFSLAPYCASKASVIALTKAFALDLAKDGITVNAVCPSFVDTELVKPVKDDKDLYKDIVDRTPVGRFAKIKEIVAPIVFLSSDESSFITGHSLMVDGGWTVE